ncbi:MAG: hypothetical protein ACRDBP_13345 [Luteolibacter sp.]
MDGKDLGGGKLGAIITLCHHATGPPGHGHLQRGKGRLRTAQAPLQEIAVVLPNAVVTGDALHRQKTTLIATTA